MSEVTLIGIDLAKTIFRINAVDDKGGRRMNKNIHRDNLVRFFAPLPECAVAMEACASSHYWGRTLESLGHTVKLIHPRYVTPYRLGDKNDANDASAIRAAAMRPDMRFVRLKTQRQSDMQAVQPGATRSVQAPSPPERASRGPGKDALRPCFRGRRLPRPISVLCRVSVQVAVKTCFWGSANAATASYGPCSFMEHGR